LAEDQEQDDAMARSMPGRLTDNVWIDNEIKMDAGNRNDV
jgi:hypothetical protein